MLNVRTDLTGTVESVQFALAGSTVITQVQNDAPYLLIDGSTQNSAYPPVDSSLSAAPGALSSNRLALGTGIYTLTVTGYTGDNASDIAGGKINLPFVVAGATRCEVEPLVRPARNQMPITLRAQNDSAESVELLSIGADGQRTSYGMIAPDETKWQTTFATHFWLLARPSDQACLYLIPDAGNEPNVDYTNADNSSNSAVSPTPLNYCYCRPPHLLHRSNQFSSKLAQIWIDQSCVLCTSFDQSIVLQRVQSKRLHPFCSYDRWRI